MERRKVKILKNMLRLGSTIINLASNVHGALCMIRLRIKEVAEEKGISIAKLARRADLDYKTVYRIANDPYAEISTFTLGRLAEALEVSVKDLVEDSPN